MKGFRKYYIEKKRKIFEKILFSMPIMNILVCNVENKKEKDLKSNFISYNMKKQINEVNIIIQKIIPILVESCEIDIKNILTDEATLLTKPKRGDIWVSESQVKNRKNFEKNILLLCEVKKELAKELKFSEMYNIDQNSLYKMKEEFKIDFEKDFSNYSNNIKYESKYKNNDWFDALIQGKYKAEKQGLNYFAVTNSINIVFYHTKKLLPIVIKKGNKNIPINFWIKKNLLNDLKENITSETNILILDSIEDAKDNPSEYEFRKFLKFIHNKNSLRFCENEFERIDALLTFVFFKFISEKIKINRESIPTKVMLWEDFTKESQKGDEGETILINIMQQISLLKDKQSGYKAEYKDFVNILDIPKAFKENKEEAQETIFEIWKEFSRYNFHGCKFDIYGSIYEIFANKTTKKKLGQYYTRRHISKILAKLTLNKLDQVDKGMKICDPACGTGGLLTEFYNILRNKMIEKYGSLLRETEDMLSKEVFYGYDILTVNVEKAKLNMFFSGDGHTNISKQDSIKKLPKIVSREDKQGLDVVCANPPYGQGVEWFKECVTWKKTKRHEAVFIEKMIKSLKYGGRFGFVVPDGICENPLWVDFRMKFLEQAKIESIISLPIHTFSPYCAQKTLLIIGNRREYETIKRISTDQEIKKDAIDRNSVAELSFKDLNDKIWMYILDFDGYANSAKRFPTNATIIKRDDELCFLHNDIETDLNEKYLFGDDKLGTIIVKDQIDTDGRFIGRKIGDEHILKKAKFVKLNEQINEKNYYSLIPETYLRPYEKQRISLNKIDEKYKKIISDMWGEINGN
jgi:type I restriction-modification system DNA methylase subunit